MCFQYVHPRLVKSCKPSRVWARFGSQAWVAWFDLNQLRECQYIVFLIRNSLLFGCVEMHYIDLYEKIKLGDIWMVLRNKVQVWNQLWCLSPSKMMPRHCLSLCGCHTRVLIICSFILSFEGYFGVLDGPSNTSFMYLNSHCVHFGLCLAPLL